MAGHTNEAVYQDVDAYQKALSFAYYPMTLRKMGNRPFHAAVSSCRLGDMDVTRATASGPFEAEHNKVPLPGDQSRVVLFIHEDGEDIIIDGVRRAKSQPGAMMLFDSSHHVRTEQCGRATVLSLALPTSLMMSAMPALSDTIFLPIKSNEGSAAILHDFAQSLWTHRDAMMAPDVTGYTLALVRLITIAFREIHDAAAEQSPAVARHYLVLRRFISSQITNPDLSVKLASERLGFSSSYLQLILRRSGVTFRKLVMDQRLELCRNALSDPGMARQSISTIAFDNGFQELSHFSRRFTEQYGVSPRDYRKERVALAAAGEPSLA